MRLASALIRASLTGGTHAVEAALREALPGEWDPATTEVITATAQLADDTTTLLVHTKDPLHWLNAIINRD